MLRESFNRGWITARQRLYLENAHLWSVEDPYLYTVKACLVRDGRVLDEDCCRLGVRKLQLDPKHGLRINGKTVKLRGACVHHDNGLIGSAAIDRAEERRGDHPEGRGGGARTCLRDRPGGIRARTRNLRIPTPEPGESCPVGIRKNISHS